MIHRNPKARQNKAPSLELLVFWVVGHRKSNSSTVDLVLQKESCAAATRYHTEAGDHTMQDQLHGELSGRAPAYHMQDPELYPLH